MESRRPRAPAWSLLVLALAGCLSLSACATGVRAKAAAVAHLELDVIETESRDDNGIPVNPKFGGQLTLKAGFLGTTQANPVADPMKCANQVGDSSCTRVETTVDDYHTGPVVCGESFKCYRGHVNFVPASYSGTLGWEGWNVPGLLDDDYDLALYRSDKAGQTTGNDGNLHLEFKHDETVGHFVTPWWTELDAAGGAFLFPCVGKRLVDKADGNFAIVIGLLGIDCVHNYQAELHPVWGLAFRAHSVSAAKGHVSDSWAVFARNWGNEGECSHSCHYLDTGNQPFTFRIPWRAGASDVAVRSARFLTNSERLKTETVEVLKVQDQAVLVRIPLDDPLMLSRVHGELELDWTSGPEVSLQRARPADDQWLRDAARHRASHAKSEMTSETITRYARTLKREHEARAAVEAAVSSPEKRAESAQTIQQTIAEMTSHDDSLEMTWRATNGQLPGPGAARHYPSDGTPCGQN